MCENIYIYTHVFFDISDFLKISCTTLQPLGRWRCRVLKNSGRQQTNLGQVSEVQRLVHTARAVRRRLDRSSGLLLGDRSQRIKPQWRRQWVYAVELYTRMPNFVRAINAQKSITLCKSEFLRIGFAWWSKS